MDSLEKKWPTDYNRVRGQDKDKGVASKKQLRYMKAKAAEGDSDAKAYVNHSEDADDLPEEGKGRARVSDKKHEHVEKTEHGEVGKHPAKLNRHYEVKYLAGYSDDGETVYVDRRMPDKLHGVDVIKYLMIHELVEKQLIDKLGFDYTEAHRCAIQAERFALEQTGMTWKEYDDFMQHWIHYVEANTKEDQQPPDLDQTPYKKPCHVRTVDMIEANVQKTEEDTIDKNSPKTAATFQDKVNNIKAKYAEKKPKTFAEQVANVKAKYKNPLEKSCDLFYGKVEGILEKGCLNEELLSHILDAELVLRTANDEPGLTELYKSADRLFDACMGKEEQVVYELSYMAKSGCEDSELALVKFVEEMQEELLKNTPIESVIADLIKSNYGPKGMGLYNPADNINRKANRTGEIREAVGRNNAVHRVTQNVNGTFAQQVDRSSRADKAKSKKNPVKVYTEEEKAKLQAERTNKSEDNSKVRGKVNGASYRMVHGYKRYTSGPKRGEYVHRHEAEKRIGRKLKTKEHVDHVDGKRSGTKNTKVMSASAHSAKTNSTRAGKGYSGSKRYEHTRD